MLVTFNCVAAPTWAITGTGAALLSATMNGLNDGRPGTLTTFRGCTSAVNPTVLTATGFSLPYAANAPYHLIVGILNSSLAVGAQTQILGNGAAAAAGTLTQNLAQFPQALAPPPAMQPYINAWYVYTPAQLAAGGTITQLAVNLTTASASQTFTLGEIIIGLAIDLPINVLGVQIVDPSKLNRSSGNQPYPALRKPFRRTSCTVSPTTFIQAFGNAANPIALQDFLYAMSVQPKLAIVSRWRQTGSATVDTDMVQRMAQAIRSNPFGEIKSQGAEQFYSVPLSFEELL